MSAVFDVRHILQLIVDRLNQRTLSQKDFIFNRQETESFSKTLQKSSISQKSDKISIDGKLLIDKMFSEQIHFTRKRVFPSFLILY
jgi:hypothetical protein